MRQPDVSAALDRGLSRAAADRARRTGCKPRPDDRSAAQKSCVNECASLYLHMRRVFTFTSCGRNVRGRAMAVAATPLSSFQVSLSQASCGLEKLVGTSVSIGLVCVVFEGANFRIGKRVRIEDSGRWSPSGLVDDNAQQGRAGGNQSVNRKSCFRSGTVGR